MSSLLRDLRYGAGTLLRERTFSLIALATLALTIGANTAIFSVLHTVLLEPLPYPRPDRVLALYNIYPGVGVTGRGANGAPDYYDRRELTDVFEAVALVDFEDATIGAEGSPERVDALRTTPEVFSVLGVEPRLGRGFVPEETVPGAEKVTILSHGLARRLFAGGDEALGQSLRIDGEPYEIVGVLPENFVVGSRAPALLVPFAFTDEQKGDDGRHSNFAGMLARLAPGTTVAAAKERVDALNQANLDRFPQFKEVLINARFETVVTPYKDMIVADVKDNLYLLQVGVALVLLIGCVNVANLMLIRSRRRLKELAVRFALGAGRWQVARQLLTESVLLALVGGAAGVLLALAGVEALNAFGIDQLPRGEAVSVDGPVLLFTLLISLGTGLLFGLIPVAHVLGADLAAIFRDGGRTGSSGPRTALIRSGLVVLQLALAFWLLVGAGLLVASFQRVLDVDPGFVADGVLTGMLTLPEARYGEGADLRAFAERTLAATGGLPGVKAVGLGSYLPFSGMVNASVIGIEGHELAPGENPPVPHWVTATPGLLETLGIPLLKGRLFEAGDGADAPRVALIDRTLADRYWPDGDALGKRLRPGLADEGAGDEGAGDGEAAGEAEEPAREVRWVTVVGIVGNVRFRDLAEPEDVGTVYFPFAQTPSRRLALAVRTEGPEPALLTDSVRAEILRLDPELALFDVETMADRLDESLLTRRTAMLLLVIFAIVALVLAAVGIYGVLAYSVTSRTREIGIRTALGAEPNRVLALILGQGGRLIAIGLGLGLGVSLLFFRLVRGLLYGVAPTDAKTLVLTTGVLGLVALIACLAPSVRASRVHPVVVLRDE